MLYSMKHVVENFNITAKTLRFYEDQGILENVSRDEIGRRVYNDGHLDWISFISLPQRNRHASCSDKRI